ncbi:unnamed protein product [Calypogeia fissa]
MAVLQASKVIERLKAASALKDSAADRRQVLLQTTADEVRAAGQPYTSVYLYMLNGDELVLEAFSGQRTKHQRITRSELVVLLRKNREFVGQIDIHSDVVDPFSKEEEAALKKVADALGDLL